MFALFSLFVQESELSKKRKECENLEHEVKKRQKRCRDLVSNMLNLLFPSRVLAGGTPVWFKRDTSGRNDYAGDMDFLLLSWFHNRRASLRMSEAKMST